MPTAYKFADFEIDEQRRELRLDDVEIPVQPRVFDLLTYLIRHRDRVVAKDELLEALWPGTVVVDGALQRVVSLARSALAQGGARNAIRTYARRGYRFCAVATESAGSLAEKPDAEAEDLGHAHDAFARNDWDAAARAFAAADRVAALKSSDLERWAQAAQWIGDSAQAIGPLERAVAAYLTQGDRRGAARAALRLSSIEFERLEMPVATGWLKRAQSLLDGAGACRELGMASFAAARLNLVEGKLEDSLEQAERALALGLELGEPDLVGLGLAYRGHAQLSFGYVEAGVDSIDEAAAAALAGNMTPWVSSMVYCSVIWACRNRGDWDRAGQWTDQFTRWCERSGLTAFPGTCRLHRAEVLSIRGELAEAEREIDESRRLLARWAPWAEGDAYRILGDLRLLQGDLGGAEAAFRRAHELGWEPQPGYAMLQMAKGEPETAVRMLENSLADRSWASGERRGLLLASLAIAAARAQDLERGRAALDELESRPALWSGTAHEAVVLRARGEVAWLEGHADLATAELREALRHWRDSGSPLNAAVTQLRLGEMLLEARELVEAELELAAAEAAFARLGAAGPREQCAALRRSI